jgi:Dna[CI] antecedent DciA-like protein
VSGAAESIHGRLGADGPVPYIRGMGFERARGPGLAARLFGRDASRTVELLRAAWPKAVGLDLSRRTEVLAVEGTTLRIRVPDARWRKVLHRMQPEILARLAEVAGSLAPRRLGFVDGGVADLPAVEPPAHKEQAVAAPCPPAVTAEAAAIADPELRARFLESAGRYLARSRRPTPR